MDRPLTIRIHDAGMFVLLLIGCGACSVEDGAFAGAPEDTLDVAPVTGMVDTFAVQAPESIAGQPSTVGPGTTGTIQPPELADPANPPLASPSIRQPLDRPPTATPQPEREAIVTGRVEVEIDPETFAPADYLLVRLVSTNHQAEAWTNREGEFYFAKVPSGRYRLDILLSPKEARPVYSRQFVVENGQELRVPAVHLPVRTMRAGAR